MQITIWLLTYLQGIIMKSFTKLGLVAVVATVLSGCTGTVYNQSKTCSTDYLLIPAISIPGAIDACNSK